MNFEVYCDESCLEALTNKDAHKFIALGGIWLPSEKRKELKDGIRNIKNKYKIKGELKWNKISPSYFNLYKEVIDYFFSSSFIKFRVIIIESRIVDNYKFNQSDAELSFYKFYYQLIHHWINDFNEYNIYLDYKLNRNKGRLNELKNVLSNSNLLSKINCVQGLPSEESLGIQLADVLTGLVSAKFNNENNSSAKCNLIDYVEKKYLKRIICPSPPWEEQFNVFRIKLRGGW